MTDGSVDSVVLEEPTEVPGGAGTRLECVCRDSGCVCRDLP